MMMNASNSCGSERGGCRGRALLFAFIALLVSLNAHAASDWVADFIAARGQPQTLEQFAAAHPVQWDWLLQDGGVTSTAPAQLTTKAIGEIDSPSLKRELASLCDQKVPAEDHRWMNLYARACAERRARRLAKLHEDAPRFVFTKHHTILPSFFAYTEGQSDAQAERHFTPGSSLCVMQYDGSDVRTRTLLDDPNGAIRDPAVSWDGKRVLFAWKKSLNEDDYHLYEMEVSSGHIRQITSGLGFADYEGAYLPNGDLIFASSRCVQTVDCWWTEVSNLYTCDANGRFLRRLGFDQVHAIHPTVNNEGRVLYTRWDYNDRGQVFPQPLFQMNADGTAQAAFYGGNSWFPTTIAHARAIPGSKKVVAILCGHHTPQAGKLAVIDTTLGREENSGVQLIAPVRETKAEHTDGYGQQGELFQYPWPLSETEFVVTYSPSGWSHDEKAKRRRGEADFGLYWMDIAGHRELLVSDPEKPCNQPVALIARTPPPVRPSFVDHRKTGGTFYIQDIYQGPGLKDIARGTIKKLRVIALDFRAAGIGNNGSGGPAGGAMSSTPVSIGNGAWDVKTVLGDAIVHEDGSAFFKVPAKTPVYFQAIDEHGRAAQTMRSWSTLQPGENQSCVGCHESRNATPDAIPRGPTLALKAGAQMLEPFYGAPRGFSFAKEIQPILNAKCISCHDARTPEAAPSADGKHAFSLLADEVVDAQAKRRWSDAYLKLTQSRANEHNAGFRGDCAGKLVTWISVQSVPAMIPPYFSGAAKSPLIPLLEKGHRGVTMTREEMDKISCWIDLLVPFCGDYREANVWTPAEVAKYERYFEKRRAMEALEKENIAELLAEDDAASKQLAEQTRR